MDERGNKETSWLFWGLEVINFAVTVASFYLDATGFMPEVPWQFIAIGALFFFAYLAFNRIIKLDKLMWDRTPNIKLKETKVRKGGMLSKKPFILSEKGEQVKSRETYYAQAIFINEPKKGTEKNHGNNVRAILTYYDDKGNIEHDSLVGRWAGSAEPQSNNHIQEIIRRRIRSDGSNETLDIVSKPEDGNSWYVYTNENYKFQNMIDESLKLTSKVIDVCIELRGDRVKRYFWVRIRNEEGEGITFEKRSSWIVRLIRRTKR